MAEIAGVDRLVQNLESLAAIGNGTQVIEAGGQALAGEQKRLIRLKLSKNSKGKLEGSISVMHVAPGRVEVGVPANTVIYALAHEYGVTIVPKKKKALHFVVDGVEVFAKSVTLPARSYVRASVPRGGKTAVRAMIPLLNKEIRQAIK